jgi:hypothetical protein
MGIATYPLRGIYKSVWSGVKSGTRHSAELSRRAEGSYLAGKMRHEGVDDRVIMERFNALIKAGQVQR